MDEPKEPQTDRDGFLSYATEWHAFSIGLYDGMKSLKTRPKGLPDNDDVQTERHYYKGAYVIGTLLQLLITIVCAAGLGSLL